MATAAVAKETSNSLKFITYATDNGIPVTQENFYAWDKDQNHGAELTRLEMKYGKAAIYRIGVLELFRRQLYLPRFEIEPGVSVSLPAGVPRTTVVQRGVATTTKMTEAQRIFMQEKTAQEIKNAVKRAKLWGLTAARIQKLVLEGLED